VSIAAKAELVNELKGLATVAPKIAPPDAKSCLRLIFCMIQTFEDSSKQEIIIANNLLKMHIIILKYKALDVFLLKSTTSIRIQKIHNKKYFVKFPIFRWFSGLNADNIRAQKQII